jgi:hypothetical protein
LHEQAIKVRLRRAWLFKMDTKLIDPHNHVPEVTPDDEWGDAEGLHPNFDAAATILPPKRQRTDEAQPRPSGRSNEGLRIESTQIRRENSEPSQALEVQQIDGKVVRLAPEEPSVERMPRHIAFHERPTREVEEPARRGEGKEWGRSRKQSVRWILGLSAAVVAMVVVGLMMLPAINKPNLAREGESGPVYVPEKDSKGTEALNAMLGRQSEAEQVFRKYASAQIADDVMHLIRSPRLVEPLLRANFRPGIVNKEWVPSDKTQWSVFEVENIQYGILEGRFPDYTNFAAYFIFGDEQLLLDWKATTAYGSAGYELLKDGKGDPSEIRGLIAPSGYYSAIFPEADYQSYQLISADKEQAIWCYARRDDGANAKLNSIFKSGDILKSAPTEQKVTLRLERGPEDALPNQWLIAEMLHKDWLIPK